MGNSKSSPNIVRHQINTKAHESFCRCPGCHQKKYVSQQRRCWCPMCRGCHHNSCSCDGCMKHNRKLPKEYYDEICAQKCRCRMCGGHMLHMSNSEERRARQYAIGQRYKTEMVGRGFIAPQTRV